MREIRGKRNIMSRRVRHCRPQRLLPFTGRGKRRVERSAFTLLEVILALVVLGASLAIFGEVMQLANRNAVEARAETQAQLLASSLMDEILAGSIDDSPASRQPLKVTDDVRWVYSVSTGTATVDGVYPLIVVVEQDIEAKLNPVKFRLVRWLPTVAETSENAEEAASDSQSGSQSTGGATGGTL